MSLDLLSTGAEAHRGADTDLLDEEEEEEKEEEQERQKVERENENKNENKNEYEYEYENDPQALVKQVHLLGALAAHTCINAAAVTMILPVLPWALPALQQAVDAVVGGLEVRQDPRYQSSKSDGDVSGAKKKKAPVEYMTAMLLCRTIHAVFAACAGAGAGAGQGQVIGAIHKYLDTWTHQLQVHCSSPKMLWKLLSLALPFWEQNVAFAGTHTNAHTDIHTDTDSLSAVVCMRYQSLVSALLDTLNACWHVHVQVCVMQTIALLLKWGKRGGKEGNVGVDGCGFVGRNALAPYICIISAECFRIAAFYLPPSLGVDLTAASVADRQCLLQEAHTLLMELTRVDGEAVAKVQTVMGQDPHLREWGTGLWHGI